MAGGVVVYRAPKAGRGPTEAADWKEYGRSRVGGAAQTRAIRRVAGRLRLDLAQYRERASFAQFGTADLDQATRAQLERGQRSTEILKQPQYQTQSVGRQASTFYALNNGYLDDIPISKVRGFEEQVSRYLETSHPEIEKEIIGSGEISSEIEATLKQAIQDFKSTFDASE